MSKLRWLSVCALFLLALIQPSPRGTPKRRNQWDAALIEAFGTWMGSFPPYGQSQSRVRSEMLRTGAGLSSRMLRELWDTAGLCRLVSILGWRRQPKSWWKHVVSRAPAVPLPFSGTLQCRFGFPFRKMTAKVAL